MSLIMVASLFVAEGTPLPRVLVMIAEQNVGQANPKYWWTQDGFTQDFEMVENTLGRALQEKGYTVVDRRVLAGKVKATPALQNSDPTDQAVKEFALQTGAEVVIVGKAVAVDAGQVLGTQMRSVQATLSARVISIDDAKIIASAATTQAFAHVDGTAGGNKALEKAAKKAGETLIPKLSETWQNRVQTIIVRATQVSSFDDLKQLKAALATKLGESVSITQRSYKGGAAELEIRVSGSGQTLADALDGLGVGKKHIAIDGVTQATVSLKLAK